MSDDQELAKISVRDQMAVAQALSKSSIVPDSYAGKPANILVAIGLGQSMGLSPAESLYRINVIKGKPTASAELIASQVRKAGHKLRITKDAEHTSVTCTIIRKDDPDYPTVVTRDKQWAQDMGLINRDNYKKQPMTMLTWRAITAAAREACPESLYGVAYTPDEMHDFDVTSSATVSTPEEDPSEDDEQVVEDDGAEDKPEQNKTLPDGMLKDMLRAAAQEIMHAKSISGQAAAKMIIDNVGNPTEVDPKDVGAYMGQINDFLIKFRKSIDKKEEK